MIKFNLNNFKNNTGFTLETTVNCKRKTTDPKPTNALGTNNISIILETDTHFYTIRFVNYNDTSTLIRIIETVVDPISETDIEAQKKERYNIMQEKNKSFEQLDFVSNRSNKKKEIAMKICAPDIYTNTESAKIFNLEEALINITYDNEFVNIYINNKLVTYFRKLNLSIRQIYNTSLNGCIWSEIKWWKHRKLLNIPMWKTENIDNFIENKPGIRFKSKINKTVTIECYVKKKENNFFYIMNNKNEYLSIVGSVDNAGNEESKLNYETNWTTDNSKDNSLWKLYDTNTNLVKNINVTEGNPPGRDIMNHSFKCLTSTLLDVANIEDENYFDNVDNSTNIMLKAKINDSTTLIDEISNYTYSIIDINPDDDNNPNDNNLNNNINNKKCYWTHNANGHISVNYEAKEIGSHFNIDKWNIEYILGVTPTVGNKFLVKYKSNKGIIRIDQLKNENYIKYFGILPTIYARWLNWNKVQDFPNVKSQDNVYIENEFNQDIAPGNVCISKDNDLDSPSNFSASCSNVLTSEQCDNMIGMKNLENSYERFFINPKKEGDIITCNDYMYKNYELVKASRPRTGENKNIFRKTDGGTLTGGNIMITGDSKIPQIKKRGEEKWYFYISPELNNSKKNIEYFPSLKSTTPEEEKIAIEEIKEWTYDAKNGGDGSRNIIINRILNDFKYDGYMEDTIKGIIRAIILPKNFVLFYITTKPEISSSYILADFKAYNCEYKNIHITTEDDYLTVNYNKYHLQITTKIGNRLVKTQKINNIENKLNKCYDLITNRICIPNGERSKTASNITNVNHLIKNDNLFNEDTQFRIINTEGKYLSDIFINDTQFCEYDPSNKYSKMKSTEIMFKGQSNSIDLEKNMPYHIHTISYESLWKLEKNDNNESYRIRNTYTGRYLINNNNNNNNNIKYLYIEYSK